MKPIVLLILILLSSFIAVSQTDNKIDDSKFKFGFNFGLSHANLVSKETLPEDSEIFNSIGGGLGILMDYSISDKFILSPKLGLEFNNSKVKFDYIDNPEYTYQVFPVTFNIMTHFAYKIGNGRFKPYIFTGPNLKLPISKKPNSTSKFYTGADFAVDIGIGIENKIKNIFFSPEIKYSYGLLNINMNPVLQNLHFHNISLLFNFK